MGASIVDVRDPLNPKPTAFGRFTRRPGHFIILLISCFWSWRNSISIRFISGRATTTASPSIGHSSMFGKRGHHYSAGLRVYDIATPGQPRAIGFMEVEVWAFTASSGPAGAMRTPPRFWTAIPITS